jgi:hypothetical protein
MKRGKSVDFTPAGFPWHESQALTVPKLLGPSADCLISI